jgi:hypothetical protein
MELVAALTEALQLIWSRAGHLLVGLLRPESLGREDLLSAYISITIPISISVMYYPVYEVQYLASAPAHTGSTALDWVRSRPLPLTGVTRGLLTLAAGPLVRKGFRTVIHFHSPSSLLYIYSLLRQEITVGLELVPAECLARATQPHGLVAHPVSVVHIRGLHPW